MQYAPATNLHMNTSVPPKSKIKKKKKEEEINFIAKASLWKSVGLKLCTTPSVPAEANSPCTYCQPCMFASEGILETTEFSLLQLDNKPTL